MVAKYWSSTQTELFFAHFFYYCLNYSCSAAPGRRRTALAAPANGLTALVAQKITCATWSFWAQNFLFFGTESQSRRCKTQPLLLFSFCSWCPAEVLEHHRTRLTWTQLPVRRLIVCPCGSGSSELSAEWLLIFLSSLCPWGSCDRLLCLCLIGKWDARQTLEDGRSDKNKTAALFLARVIQSWLSVFAWHT